MTRTLLLGALTLVALALPARADDKKATTHAGLERLKKLAGSWYKADADGKPTKELVSVFKVTAAGSAVHETIFPGSDHEMVTLYHLDGKDLILTHYCAAGNQPRMKADPKAAADTLSFVFVGGTNLDPAKDMHMHEGSIRFIDDDHLEWSWCGFVGGKAQDDHKISLKLVRKK